MTGALNPSQLTPLIFMGGIAFFIVLIIFSAAYKFSKLRNGSLADGTITEKELERDEGKFYHVTYNFSDASGQKHSKKIQVTRRHFEMLSEGQRVNVIYQPDKPGNSFIHDAEMQRSFFNGTRFMALAAIVLAVCGYGLYTTFK